MKRVESRWASVESSRKGEASARWRTERRRLGSVSLLFDALRLDDTLAEKVEDREGV